MVSGARGGPGRFPPRRRSRRPNARTPVRPRPRAISPGCGKSSGLGKGIILVANKSDNVKGSTTVCFTGRKTDITVICLRRRRSTRGAGRTVRTRKRSYLLVSKSLKDRAFYGSTIEGALSGFKRVSMLIGGTTRRRPRGDLLSVATRRLRGAFQAGVFSFFRLAGTMLPRLGGKDSVVGATSVATCRNGRRLVSCSSAGKTVISFAHSLTGSLTKRKVHMGKITPKPV